MVYCEQFYLGLNDILRRGSNYSLFIEFRVLLKEGLDGFYLSSYKIGGKKRLDMGYCDVRWVVRCRLGVRLVSLIYGRGSRVPLGALLLNL